MDNERDVRELSKKILASIDRQEVAMDKMDALLLAFLASQQKMLDLLTRINQENAARRAS